MSRWLRPIDCFCIRNHSAIRDSMYNETVPELSFSECERPSLMEFWRGVRLTSSNVFGRSKQVRISAAMCTYPVHPSAGCFAYLQIYARHIS